MKNVKSWARTAATVMSVCVVAGGISFSANASYPKYLESDLVKICTAIRDNKSFQLHMAIKKSGLTYRAVEKGLVCDSMDIHTFAQVNKADATGDLLARRLKYDRTLTASR
ncbi:DUF3718 domain-containing protein [Salinimonas iocasae]|uniref:DUF3718 domain-containing protein n=1 Tax=Salinimonas iocasae TaxID=2572577 RepID=A0A5B7YFD3_9ALTE|nr:DUF3718 domain-containing protein [Salinimonas iocasae]QCZ94404.1 DUF3718 domain-containing protein [Salinimonas iocasae]